MKLPLVWMTGPPSRPGINKMKNNTVASLRPAACDWLSGGPPGLKSGHVELHLQRRVWTKVRLWSVLVYLSALSTPAWPAGGAVATAGLVINTRTVWFFLKMSGFHQERCLLIKRAFTFCHSFLSDSANYFSQFVFPCSETHYSPKREFSIWKHFISSEISGGKKHWF